ncbi:MAG: hypothetical protein R3D52_13650 [Xanthobacteraceae bacterium]
MARRRLGRRLARGLVAIFRRFGLFEQQFERVDDRFTGEQSEQRAIEPERVAHVEDAGGGLVVEQDAVIEIAHDHAFGEIEENRFEPAFLFLRTQGGGGHRLVDLATGGL